MTQFIISLNMDSGIGKRINLILKRKSLTQEAFANKIDTQRPTVSKWIGGQIAPSYDMIFKIKTEFPDINGDWLISGDGNWLIANQEKLTVNEQYTGYAPESWKDLVKTKDIIIKDKDEEIKFLRGLLEKK